MFMSKAATECGVRFAIKNTFIDGVAEEEEEEEQPIVRRRTEPCLCKSFGDDYDDEVHPTQMASADSSEGTWSDSDDRSELSEAGAEPASHAKGVRMTIKNTFIDVEEDETPAASRSIPRRSTEPALGCELGGDDGSTDCHSEIDECGVSNFSSPAGACEAPALMAATPTPWAQIDEERLRFWTVAAVPAAPARVASPDAPAAPAAPAPTAAPAPSASAADSAEHLCVRSKDKHIAVTQLGDVCRVEWTVDARKLRGSDKQVVSPALEVTTQKGGGCSTFKMMLYPKGGSSFRKADGEGSVQLKCCSDLPDGTREAASVSFSVGTGALAQPTRGPFVHHFASSSVFSLPKGGADWDFSSSVEASSLTFTVVMELTPLA